MKRTLMVGTTLLVLMICGFAPCVHGGDAGPGYVFVNQEIGSFQLKQDNYQTYTWSDDGSNMTVPEDSQMITVFVTVTLAKENASSWLWAKWLTDVDVNITSPSDAVIMDRGLSTCGVVETEDQWVVTKYRDVSFTVSEEGNYSLEANYTAFIDEEWVWVETSTTTFAFNATGGGEEEGGGTAGEDTYAWINDGGLMGILGAIGFFGLIGCPALFIWAARQKGADKFQMLVSLIMAMVMCGAFFLMGVG